MFGKSVFAGPLRNNGSKRTLIKQAFLGSFLTILPTSYHNVDIYSENSLPGAVLSSKFFLGSCRERWRTFPESAGSSFLLTQNNLYGKVAHLGAACPWSLHDLSHFSLPSPAIPLFTLPWVCPMLGWDFEVLSSESSREEERINTCAQDRKSVQWSLMTHPSSILSHRAEGSSEFWSWGTPDLQPVPLFPLSPGSSSHSGITAPPLCEAKKSLPYQDFSHYSMV